MRLRSAPLFCLFVVLGGCGGSGGSQTLPTHRTFRAETLAVSPNLYSYPLSVLDDGYVLGVVQGSDLRPHPAVWPNPTTLIQIPMLDDKAYSQQATAISPNRRFVVGRSIDVNNSGGPGRGWIYDVQTQSLQVLKIEGSDQLEVVPTNVTDGRIIEGNIRDLGGAHLPSSRFRYDANTDTVEYISPVGGGPSDPGYPQAVSRYAAAQSPDGRFVVGRITLDSGTYGAFWDRQNHTYRLVGTAQQELTGSVVSNDGSVALYYGNQTDIPPYGLIHGKAYDLLQLLRDQQIGTNWTRLNFMLVSPNGHHIAAVGMQDINFRDSVRITIP